MAGEQKELVRLREGIDHIDDELLRLISERAQLAHRIGEIKHGNIYRPEREAQVLRGIAERNTGPLPAAAVQHLFREIMSACLALEQPLVIAYLGPAGTYSESAAKKHFGTAPSFTPCVAIGDVFRTVEAGNADYGVVPVENSTEGAVGRSLDLLLSSSLKICGEVSLPIHHNLMSRAASAAAVKNVYSHAQSLGQCHEWLSRNMPLVPTVAVASNAEAARLAAEDMEGAAIAGEAAASLYELPILAANIEDDPNNTTRFVVIAHHDAGPSGKDRTSLICSAQNRPGAVYELLGTFARHGVSMSRFESRPARGLGGSPWEYVFYVDLEGHRLDASLAVALTELKACAGFVKELGSYPRAAF
ncbi:prephenate dehydratase [Denitratisoma oestradiolicum]|uniref:Bifunctional chorismate mutase/prephenate dehydratase n=1 Tax=Denitratisoma oestradiolicum TaxID=311182 RepID=A0A6S6XV90_9PROT|nr:prephenate dehydratase [Denitratisoma oestradiolicum]CAB1369964.1 Chorismate mutase / Prephenate dehydratase [Denitratisoma oestradiolicum]